MTIGSSFERVAECLNSGQPVVIPTDTVYGLAIKVSEWSSPDILFEIKKRPVEKSIPWLISSVDDFERYTESVPEWAYELAGKYWPGALTLVCRASAIAPAAFIAEDGSLALRIPNHELVLRLLAQLDAPLATTSANISGQGAVSCATELDPEVAERVAAIMVDPDEVPGKEAVPSTIVSCLGDRPVVLRQGALDLTADLARIEAAL